MILSETQKIFLTVLISIIIGLSLGALTFFIVKHFSKKSCGICSTGQTCDTSTGNCVGPSGPSGPSGATGATGPVGSNCYKDIDDVFHDQCGASTTGIGTKLSCCGDSKFCLNITRPLVDKPPNYRYYCTSDQTCKNSDKEVKDIPSCNSIDKGTGCHKSGSQFCK